MKRRTLINLALFPFVVLAILVVALLTLDLNAYHDQVTWSLEQAFARPVKLGAIDLTLDGGLALEVHDLEVGLTDDPNHFRTERGSLRLSLLPLLTGNITFNEIHLEKPVLRVTFDATRADATIDAEPSRPLFTSIPTLRGVHLIDAELELRNLAPEIPILRLHDLELEIIGLHPGEVCQITMQGALTNQSAPTPLTLNARFGIPHNGESWFDQRLDLQAAARDVVRDAWREVLPKAALATLPEIPFDLHLSLNHGGDGQLSATATIENARQDGECLLPNLTVQLDSATLKGSYPNTDHDMYLSFDGRGHLASCGEQLASYSLRHDLERRDGTLRFDGRIASRFESEAALDWLTSGTAALRATGALPVEITVAGTGERADWTLQGDFTQVGLSLGELLLKTPGIPGALTASGTLGGGKRQLERGHLELGALNADLAPVQGDNGEAVVALDLKPLELSSLAEIVPALAQWDLRGTLSGGFRFQKGPEGWQRTGTLTLEDLAAEHPYPLGPVRNTRARLELHNRSLRFACFPLGLGDSQLQVRGEVADLGDPVFVVHAESSRMLARDLIFRRPEVNLNDLSGTLRIDRRGIDFVRAHVRLDQGTVADVDGRLDFPTNRLNLNVHAAYGHIDEVIALFSGPPRPYEEARAERRKRSDRPPFKVVVEAETDKGEISHVGFSKARGTVTVEGGSVVVYPLHFSGRNQGEATARVHYTSREGQSGWLRVTGHLHQFEAQQIYNEYMQRSGDLRGPMDADFFLQGPADGTFRSRVDGSVYLEIHKGNFRKFTTLARAFSLLNVSQLFTGELPDVSGRGMNFELARGTLSFGGGYVYTDDLAVFSNSLNMSFIGRADLAKQTNDYILGVQPLQTVDKVVSSIPLVGWVLTGDEKTMFTVHFQVKGPWSDPEVTAIPGSSLGSGILGIFQRTLRLPGKLVGQ